MKWQLKKIQTNCPVLSQAKHRSILLADPESSLFVIASSTCFRNKYGLKELMDWILLCSLLQMGQMIDVCAWSGRTTSPSLFIIFTQIIFARHCPQNECWHGNVFGCFKRQKQIAQSTNSFGIHKLLCAIVLTVLFVDKCQNKLKQKAWKRKTPRPLPRRFVSFVFLITSLFPFKEGGFGHSRVAGFADFYPLVFGFFPKKLRGFSSQVYLTGNGYCHFCSSGFRSCSKMFSGFKPHRGYQCVKFLPELFKLRSSGFSGLSQFSSGLSGFDSRQSLPL